MSLLTEVREFTASDFQSFASAPYFGLGKPPICRDMIVDGLDALAVACGDGFQIISESGEEWGLVGVTQVKSQKFGRLVLEGLPQELCSDELDELGWHQL